MNFRVTALLLACAGAADSFRMAKSAANSKPRIFGRRSRSSRWRSRSRASSARRGAEHDGRLLLGIHVDRPRDVLDRIWHHVLFPPAGVLVHAHGACARYMGRTAQVVRLVNAEFAKLRKALTAAETEVGL